MKLGDDKPSAADSERLSDAVDIGKLVRPPALLSRH
jgi:hypothetical protein